MMLKKNDDKQPNNNLDIEQEALAGKIFIFKKSYNFLIYFLVQYTKIQALMKVMT